MDESRVENLARASSENGTATVIGLNWARNVVQVSAAVSGEERCVTRQITAAWETTHLLANIDHKFSVLAITETWIRDDDRYDLNFDGYNFISNHRSDRTGVGVGLYIDEKLTFKVLTEYNISNSSVLESLFVEICIPNNKNIIIGAIYRPPTGNPEEFLDKFNELLPGVTRANKHCYVTGDFNLDLMKHDIHSITAQFVEVFFFLWSHSNDN